LIVKAESLPILYLDYFSELAPTFLACKSIFSAKNNAISSDIYFSRRETTGATLAQVLVRSQADLEPGILAAATDIRCFLRQCATL
jgi:hypothetical protein